MITIDRVYYSQDETKINAVLSMDKENGDSFSDITDVVLYKNIGGVEREFTCDYTIDYSESSYDEKIIFTSNIGHQLSNSDGQNIKVIVSGGHDLSIGTYGITIQKDYIFDIYSTSVLYTYVLLDDGNTITQLDAGYSYLVSIGSNGLITSTTQLTGGIFGAETSNSAILSVDLSTAKSVIDGYDFNEYGISAIKVTFQGGSDKVYFINENEFYEYKLKMFNQTIDKNDTLKMTKKLTLFTFLESMIRQSLSSRSYINAGNAYSELVKLSLLGYTDVLKNNYSYKY